MFLMVTRHLMAIDVIDKDEFQVLFHEPFIMVKLSHNNLVEVVIRSVIKSSLLRYLCKVFTDINVDGMPPFKHFSNSTVVDAFSF